MNSVAEAVLTAMLIGAIGIFSPTRAALSIVMLAGPVAPWPRALALLLGSTLVFAVAAIIGLLGVQASGVGEASPTVNIVLGLTLIVVAGSMLVVHRRRMNDPDPQPASHPVLKAFGVGIGVAIQSFGRLLVLLAGGYRLGLITEPIVALGAIGIMILVWQVPVWGPMAIYVFNRNRFDALEQRARPALDRIEGGVWGAVIVGAVGAWMLLLGLVK
ncbi:MAG TPA: hypothetical protein VI277_05875 [Candidatus Limnocylindria bacterium]